MSVSRFFEWVAWIAGGMIAALVAVRAVTGYDLKHFVEAWLKRRKARREAAGPTAPVDRTTPAAIESLPADSRRILPGRETSPWDEFPERRRWEYIANLFGVDWWCEHHWGRITNGPTAWCNVCHNDLVFHHPRSDQPRVTVAECSNPQCSFAVTILRDSMSIHRFVGETIEAQLMAHLRA